MPTAVPELIALEIVDRLEDITTVGGYAFTVSEVKRPTRNGENWQRKHLGIGVIQGPSERVPERDCPGNPPAIAYQVTFNLECICKDPEASTAAHATSENEMAAAVVKAIASDGATWYTMNGNAIYTDFGANEPFEPSDGEMNGVTVPVIVLYRVAENDPYTVRS